MLTIYGRDNSINVRKVLWACSELDIAFVRQDWGIGFRATSEPSFVAMNPNAMVPVIDDEGFVLWESNSILRYLAAQYGPSSGLSWAMAGRSRDKLAAVHAEIGAPASVGLLQADGAEVFGPGCGDQACGEVGDGRMLEPHELLDDLVSLFTPKRLAGKRLLITAGPTFEPIDPVRGITNHSSGKMGFAIARAAAEAGADVTLVAGPVHLPTPRGVRRHDVMTAQQMLDTVLPLAAQHDVFVATAAVADWRPATLAEHKIKKDGKKLAPTFELTENPDILATVASMAHPPYCVGFAAESEHLLEHARAKLLRKRIPLIVGNLGPATFGRDDNSLLVVDAHAHHPLPADGSQADKLSLARLLMQEIADRLARLPA